MPEPQPTRQIFGIDYPLAILSAMSFISSLGIALMVPLIPLYAVSLGATPFQLGILTSGFAITSAIGQLSGGLLNDRFGSRGLVRTGIAFYAGANLLIASAFDALSLIAYRSLAGLGGGLNLVAQRLYVAETALANRRAYANGILSAASSAGQVAGPAIGGIVVALSDLRFLFVLVGVTSGIAFLAGLFLPRTTRHAPMPTNGAAQSSLLNRAALVLLISQSILLAGYGSFITSYAPLAKSILNWETLEVGIVFSFFGLGSIILGPGLSHLADRVDRRIIALLSVLPITLFGLGLVLALPQWIIFAIAFASGGGLTGYNAAWFALLTDASPDARRGRTFGIVNALAQLGIVVGAMAASAIWENVGLPAAMIFASGAILLASLTLLALPRQTSAA